MAKFPNSTYPNIVSNLAPYDTTPFTVKATRSTGSPSKTNSSVTVQALPTKTSLTINLGARQPSC